MLFLFRLIRPVLPLLCSDHPTLLTAPVPYFFLLCSAAFMLLSPLLCICPAESIPLVPPPPARSAPPPPLNVPPATPSPRESPASVSDFASSLPSSSPRAEGVQLRFSLFFFFCICERDCPRSIYLLFFFQTAAIIQSYVAGAVSPRSNDKKEEKKDKKKKKGFFAGLFGRGDAEEEDIVISDPRDFRHQSRISPTHVVMSRFLFFFLLLLSSPV
jgi:hypothetical protein